MKKIYIGLILLTASLPLRADDLQSTLQKGLFEEEANHNLRAAIKAYQAVIQMTDQQRRFAATAVFRLGECYRKLGQTNDAAGQYQRLVREFSDHTNLVALSQQNLASLGLGAAAAAAPAKAAIPSAEGSPQQEEQEIHRIEAIMKDSPDLINSMYDLGNHGAYLHGAAERGNLEVIRFLVANKAEVNLPNRNGDTPLHLAADSGRKAACELLLASGAKVNARNNGGVTPLFLAARGGFKSVVEVLLAHKAALNPPEAGPSPLSVAAANGFKAIAQLLVDQGADLEARAADGTTPLSAAASNGRTEMVSWLLAKGAAVNSKDRNDSTSLLLVLRSGNSSLEVIKQLLEHGAQVNLTDAPGNSPLHYAVDRNSEELLRLLLQYKPDLEVRDREGMTPLEDAVSRRKPAMCTLLLEAGAQPNGVRRGENPLHRAVRNQDFGIAEQLLAHKADVNAVDSSGSTALSIAKNMKSAGSQAEKRQEEFIQLLLKKGADENLQRRGMIMVSRPARQWSQPVFFKDTNALNAYSLYELLAQAFAIPQMANHLQFPDLEKVRIRRLNEKGDEITVYFGPAGPYNEGLRSGQCTEGDWQYLRWGDIVEIPEADHRLNEPGRGLPPEVGDTLRKCLERKVSIIVKGITNVVTLVPPSLPAVAVPSFTIASFRLKAALQGSGLLLTSSDLSRVRVTSPRRPKEIMLNLADANAYNDNTNLWLQDGDIIEVPEKSEGKRGGGEGK
jgi:ankyrin repeat protein